jgi:hypothetical protein
MVNFQNNLNNPLCLCDNKKWSLHFKLNLFFEVCELCVDKTRKSLPYTLGEKGEIFMGV